jgi:hypothetical protein
MASNTVVMPAAAISASCDCIALAIGKVTFGRGMTWRSRLSVCTSTRPGSNQSPCRSIADGTLLGPSSISAITPSRTTTVPQASVCSAQTTRACVRISSWGMGCFRAPG